MIRALILRYRRAAVVAMALMSCTAASQATVLNVSWVGSVTNCSDASLNETINITFSSSGVVSGTYTIFHLSLGNNLGGFDVPILTADIDAVSAGALPPVTFGPSPLGAPGCLLEGTLTVSVEGGSGVGPDAPGNVATTQATVNSFVQTTLPAISNRIVAVFRGQAGGVSTAGNVYTISGMAAGDGDRPPIGAWAGYSFTDSRTATIIIR